MLMVANAAKDSVTKRIVSGIKVDGTAARPLKGDVKSDKYVPYAEQKRRKGLQGIRNWVWSGKTLKSMQVLRVNEDRAVIGFVGSRADRITTKLNRIDRMFGLGVSDEQAVNAAVNKLIESKTYITFKPE
jgi:hypothetical protein